MCVCFDGRFARHEQANGPTGRGRRMKRRDLFAPQNRPERNPAERPGRDVLARRANRDAGCDAAVRPHGRMRDGPKGRSPLRHAKPSRGGRKALPTVYGAVLPHPKRDGPANALLYARSCRMDKQPPVTLQYCIRSIFHLLPLIALNSTGSNAPNAKLVPFDRV